METRVGMNQELPEPERVKLALSEIAEARQRLQLACDILNAPATAAGLGEAPPAAVHEPRQPNIAEPPQALFDLAHEVVQQIFPEPLAQRGLQHDTRPRDWLYRVYALSCAPRNITEPVATIVVMLAAAKFGLRHQLLLQTETRLGLAHKAPIPCLDLFLEAFIAAMLAADPSDVRFNDWLKRTVAAHYPNFSDHKRLDLPNGDYLLIPDKIEPIHQQVAAPIAASALSSPIAPAAFVIVPPGSGWKITLGYAAVLHNEDYPAFHGKHHSGIDLYRWDAHKAPVHAMRGGLVIDSVYLPQGFGNTVTIEHDDGTCLRYTHLDKKLVKTGDRVIRGQQIGTVGKGAKNIYPAHLHLDMPRSRTQARAGTYYDTVAEVVERFIDPLSQIPPL